MKTTSLTDCKRLADAVKSVGGIVPTALGNLLAAHALLASPGGSQAPESEILDCALNGTLDHKTLDKLVVAAATAQMVNTYRQALARESEHTLVGEWHRQLKSGGADEVLNSLRPNFDKHAAAIAEARSLIDPESSAEHILASAAPELVTAWQQLDGHLKVVTKIAAIASQFGCRPTAQFPQVTEYHLAENARVDDRALMCADGPLVAASALFARPDTGHRGSPFFRTSLRLHSIAEAQARYDRFAADEFDKVNSGPVGGWVDGDGKVHEDARPVNPYRAKVSAT